MTTTFAVPDTVALQQENGHLRAQVKRLQRFAFRDLLAATPDELAEAVASLTPEVRASLRRHLTGSLAERPTTSTPALSDDDARAVAWRIAAGLIERPATT